MELADFLMHKLSPQLSSVKVKVKLYLSFS